MSKQKTSTAPSNSFSFEKDANKLKKKEHQLMASEIRYRRLFETAQDGVLLIDYKTGMILDVNPFLINMLGYSKEDFLKKYLWEVGVFKNTAASKENFLTLQTKKYIRFEDLPLQTKSGKKAEVEFVANAYKVDGETIIQCNIRDITERKNLERENIHKNKDLEFYKSIIENSDDAITTKDLNGIIKSWNVGAEKLYGYKKNEVIDKSINIIVPPALQIEVKNILSKIGRGQIIDNYETQRVKKDGTIVDVSLSISPIKNDAGAIMGASTIGRDITARKEKEETEKDYRAFFDSIIDAIFVADPATRKLIECNKSAQKMTGYSKKEILSMAANELHPKDVQEKTMEGFKLQAEGKIIALESEVLAKDGKRIPVLINGAPIRIEGKNYIQGIFRDFTQLKDKEQKLKDYISKTEKINQSMIGRELKMIELKKRIKQLENPEGKTLS